LLISGRTQLHLSAESPRTFTRDSLSSESVEIRLLPEWCIDFSVSPLALHLTGDHPRKTGWVGKSRTGVLSVTIRGVCFFPDFRGEPSPEVSGSCERRFYYDAVRASCAGSLLFVVGYLDYSYVIGVESLLRSFLKSSPRGLMEKSRVEKTILCRYDEPLLYHPP